MYDLLFMSVMINIIVELFFFNGFFEDFVLFVIVKVDFDNIVDLFMIMDIE